jgi:sporulation protein YlmC with PRC-barrel domain
MSYQERGTYGVYSSPFNATLFGAHTLVGGTVRNAADEHLGDIKDIVLDIETGKIAYAVLAFGGLFSIGEKLFAVPWSAFKFDAEKRQFILNVDKDRFENAPGFDVNHWPDVGDKKWVESIHTYYSSLN